MIVNCTYGKGKWEVEVKRLSNCEQVYEVMVSGHGSNYHIIARKYACGHYMCIPSIGISCELAELTDEF